MPNERHEGDKNGNCPPGTVVDNTIVASREFDFCKLFIIKLRIIILINFY